VLRCSEGVPASQPLRLVFPVGLIDRAEFTEKAVACLVGKRVFDGHSNLTPCVVARRPPCREMKHCGPKLVEIDATDVPAKSSGVLGTPREEIKRRRFGIFSNVESVDEPPGYRCRFSTVVHCAALCRPPDDVTTFTAGVDARAQPVGAIPKLEI